MPPLFRRSSLRYQRRSPKSESAEASVKDPAVHASQSEAVLVEVEHLPKSEPKASG